MTRRWLVAGAFFGLAAAGGVAAFYRPAVPVAELEKEYGDAASRFLELDGLRVHFKDEGRGPVLVLLHGFAASLHTWDGWVAELGDTFRIIRLDLPGYGLTGPSPSGPWGAGEQVAFLDRLVEALGLEHFSLAGNSMGGGIAWRYTSAHPERVERLILIDAAGAPPPEGASSSSGSRRGGVTAIVRLPLLRDLVPRFTPRFLFERALREVYADDAKVTPELVDRYYRLSLREGNREAMMARLEGRDGGGKDVDRRELLGQIHIPSLILWGAEDTWIPPGHAERFRAALPAAEVILYPGVGHVPMEEKPEETARDVREFLRPVVSASGRSAETP